MDDAWSPSPAHSANSGGDSSPSPFVRGDADVKLQPPVKMEFGESLESFISREVRMVTAPDKCSQSDPLVWTPSEEQCRDAELNVNSSSLVQDDADIKFQPPMMLYMRETELFSPTMDSVLASEECLETDPLELSPSEVKCKQEHAAALESPSSYDFIGFTDTDLDKANYALLTTVKRLRSYITELQARQEVRTHRKRRRHRPTAVCCTDEGDLDEYSVGESSGSYCDQCGSAGAEGCPLHGPMEIVPDTKVASSTRDPERCIKSLPECLSAGRSHVPVAAIGVLAENDLPTRRRFGPLEGTITPGGREAGTIGYSWKVMSDGVTYHVDAADPSSSNWLRLVNCARTIDEQNLTAFRFREKVYFRTFKPIVRGSELLVYFGDDCARELSSTSTQPRTRTGKAPPAPPAGQSSSDVDATVRCPHCSFKCLGQRRLEKHVTSRHERVGNHGRHKCEWCEYSTENPGHLINHRQTHTGERPHRCDVCGKAFGQRSHLTSHLRLHTGERPYKCDVCGRTFNRRTHVASHRRVHTSVRKRGKRKRGNMSILSDGPDDI